jgi:hypothetical protein
VLARAGDSARRRRDLPTVRPAPMEGQTAGPGRGPANHREPCLRQPDPEPLIVVPGVALSAQRHADLTVFGPGPGVASPIVPPGYRHPRRCSQPVDEGVDAARTVCVVPSRTRPAAGAPTGPAATTTSSERWAHQ